MDKLIQLQQMLTKYDKMSVKEVIKDYAKVEEAFSQKFKD